MIAQTTDQNKFNKKARRIKAQAVTILKKWGLLPRFKRWRLTKDRNNGMIVLFGVLNDTDIAAHASISFNDYFAPPLLHDLANELQVQVVSHNSEGYHYAFILDRGQIDTQPAQASG